MRFLCLTVLGGLALQACAQSPAPDINTYIHHSWDALQRSTSDCNSLADSKLTTSPVVYLPFGERIPADVKAMEQKCKVDIRHLPRTIEHEGDLDPNQLPIPGLLYLPHPYVVPGGRFNEMYGWDSYFIILGEIADNRVDLARGTVENFFYEIEHYGAILNANRTYYLTRSQPPFLSSMVLAVYRAELPTQPRQARAFLHEAMPYLMRDHELWTAAPHLDAATGLSRYIDLGTGPVPELADDSTYYVDVIHWLLAHPEATPPGYLHKLLPADNPAAPHSNVSNSQHEQPSCATHCVVTSAEGYALTENFFSGDRAMRESGFDTTFRFGPFSGSTTNFAPVCLNALLFKYERDVAFIATTLGDFDDALAWAAVAGDRLERINAYMWDQSSGLYTDFNLTTHTHSPYRYLTVYYALWAGVASPEQAGRLVSNLPEFERPGGLQMSPLDTGVQWDAPFGWAPTNWLSVAGLERYGYHTEARRIAREFTSTVETNFARDGTIREKYNVVSADANVAVAAGYKTNVIGFGWTNAIYVKMQQLLATH